MSTARRPATARNPHPSRPRSESAGTATSTALISARRSRQAAAAANAPDGADDGQALMGIAEMCETYGVSPRALRFYESKGLLTPQRLNGTRVYGKDDRARLSRILRAKSLGMALADIKAYLDMYGEHGEGRVQQLAYVVEAAAAAMRDLERKRAQIDTALEELRLIHDRSLQRLRAKQRKPRAGAGR
ncbi:MAG: MerR family DNA-binding transcriptional regulator [Burkholderiales bacterium]|nr:MerR family DNA-binding transcriptional regulator [Burkholderiales bacterium]